MRIITIMIFLGSEEFIISHSFVLLWICLTFKWTLLCSMIWNFGLTWRCFGCPMSMLVLGIPTPVQFVSISPKATNINAGLCIFWGIVRIMNLVQRFYKLWDFAHRPRSLQLRIYGRAAATVLPRVSCYVEFRILELWCWDHWLTDPPGTIRDVAADLSSGSASSATATICRRHKWLIPSAR